MYTPKKVCDDDIVRFIFCPFFLGASLPNLIFSKGSLPQVKIELKNLAIRTSTWSNTHLVAATLIMLKH